MARGTILAAIAQDSVEDADMASGAAAAINSTLHNILFMIALSSEISRRR
ncbi:hypothetical protein [Bifidobacterium aquikefiri]